jgi:hypothetical protein
MSLFYDKNDTHNSIEFLLMLVFALLVLLSGQRASAQPAPTGGPIHGFVAVKVPAVQEPPQAAAGSSIQTGATIVVPNISVTAQNVATNASSAPVVTNPQGFFQTPSLPPGRYRICVSGAGFVSSCDDATVDDPGPYTIVNHLVLIRPAETAIIGTVTLSDHRTPCFWARPAFSPTSLTARASLLDLAGKVIAGAVEGNASGQYVLPVPRAADRSNLRVECEAASPKPISRRAARSPCGIWPCRSASRPSWGSTS